MNKFLPSRILVMLSVICITGQLAVAQPTVAEPDFTIARPPKPGEVGSRSESNAARRSFTGEPDFTSGKPPGETASVPGVNSPPKGPTSSSSSSGSSSLLPLLSLGLAAIAGGAIFLLSKKPLKSA